MVANASIGVAWRSAATVKRKQQRKQFHIHFFSLSVSSSLSRFDTWPTQCPDPASASQRRRRLFLCLCRYWLEPNRTAEKKNHLAVLRQCTIEDLPCCHQHHHIHEQMNAYMLSQKYRRRWSAGMSRGEGDRSNGKEDRAKSALHHNKCLAKQKFIVVHSVHTTCTLYISIHICILHVSRIG